MRSETEPAGTQSQDETSTGRVKAVQHPMDALIFHPLAAKFARGLSRTAITPNMVSFAGGLAVAIAGLAYTQLDWPVSFLIGFAVHASWHVLDGADGDLARLTGKSSPQGEIFDGICDYTGHIVLYVLLAWSLSASLGWIAWALAVAAGASRIPQANFYETQRRQYMQWVHGIGWIGADQNAATPQKDEMKSTLGELYLTIASLVAPSDATVEGAFADPRTADPIQHRLKALGAKALYGSTLLGAPYRTLALGLSMLAGSPLWFFVFEIALLNVVLILSIMRARRTLAELLVLAEGNTKA